MSFEKLIRIPEDRIGVLIGKSGKIKLKIEQTCSVKLNIDSKNGEVQVLSDIIDEKFSNFQSFGNYNSSRSWVFTTKSYEIT